MPGKEADWRQFVVESAIPWLQTQRGLIAYLPGQSFIGGDRRNFLLTMLWESSNDIRAAIGDFWRRPRFLVGEDKLLEKFEVEHFESYGSPIPDLQTFH